MPRRHLTRRELVAAAAATGLSAAAVPDAWAKGLLKGRPRVGPGAFLDGVASGEPSDTAVTFWSRLDTERLRSGARLVVARDPGMRRVVATAVVPTGRAIDGSLKTRIGGLAAATEYFYAWESGTNVSEVGRTRTTAPARSDQPQRIAFSSCQNYAHGFFTAHAHAAQIPDLDLYLFLGDYVYERDHAAVRADDVNAVDLGSYRRKYRLYRSDPGLRELHRLHPVAHVWDDHEVENNYSDGNPAPAPAQRMAGYRASFEWLPRMSLPSDRHRVYKRLSLGRMVDLFLLDERQYRLPGTDQSARMLGDAQLSWLLRGLASSSARWKLVGNQVAMTQTPYGSNDPAPDSWDGYPADRAALLGAIERAGISDVVFLTGDAHVFLASLLASDFTAFGDGAGKRAAATEFLGGSVTSPGRVRDEARVRSRAPWIQEFDGSRNGYAQLDLTAQQLQCDYRDADLLVPDGTTYTFDRFVQPAGQNAFTRQRLV